VNTLPCSCGKSARFKRCTEKNVLSSVGHIAVPRRYYACGDCRAKQTPWEDWAGVTGMHRVTPHARRMIVLAGSGCSFDEAQRNLKELCHLPVSNDVVRRICDEEGEAVRKWMNGAPEIKESFDKAEGVVEFSTDGLKINTVDGWREIRQSVISKRTAALPVAPEQWADRPLEAPTARVAVCAIAHCDLIGAGWQRLVKTLGLAQDREISVIADGAKWIWDQAAKRFKDRPMQWVVDVYHVMLYLFAAAAALGKAPAEAWVGQKVIELIEMGGPKFIAHLKATGPPDAAPATAEAWEKLLGYLTDNQDSLWYGRRLKQGLPIGSGLIEGAGKSTLARRLKINSARWRIRRAERMGAIRCLQYSGMWETYWDAKRAA
jgi:hypothetical protein